MKSPKLSAFSHRVEHLFFCQVPPKKSTVAALDLVPVGTLRRAWWRGLPVVAVGALRSGLPGCARSACGLVVAVVCPGPGGGGGLPGRGRPTVARWVGRAALGPSGPWPDTPGEVVGGGSSDRTRPAGFVMPRNAVRGCHGLGRWERLETPGAEVIGNTQGGRFEPEMVGARWEAAPHRDFCIKKVMPCSIFYFFSKKGRNTELWGLMGTDTEFGGFYVAVVV